MVEWLQRDGLGGVLLFSYDLPNKRYGKNLQSCKQIKRLTEQLRHYAGSNPLFIALDYEGGAIDRLALVEGCRSTMPPSELALLSNEALTTELNHMARTVAELGFNLNFAPVIDLNLNETDGIIGKLGRCFSSDPAIVSDRAQRFVRAFAEQGVMCAYKHFPGHGSAAFDTHEGCVDVTTCFQMAELEPYVTCGHDQRIPTMVMTAHVVNRQLDPSGLPATLSYTMLTTLLREKLGFKGIIVSDDLQMHAISNHYSLDDALQLTINAGADRLIFGNQLGNISATEVVDRIERLVLSGAIPEARIDDALRRCTVINSALVESQ